MSKLRRLLLAKHLNEINEDDIMMTADSNPEVMRCCYLAGFAKSPYFMTYKEAADVTDADKFRDMLLNSDIVNFDVGKYFTGITGTLSYLGLNMTKLKYYAFPPNMEFGINSGGFAPNCETYNIGMWEGSNLPNGCEVISNPKIKTAIIDPNNYKWFISYGHLGKGTFIKSKLQDSILWLLPNSSKDVIMPLVNPNHYTSVSFHFRYFKGESIISNNLYAGNAAFTGGGQNLRKLVSFYNTSYEYSPWTSTTIAVDVPKDVKREFIVNANDPQNFEQNSIYTNYLLNPEKANFQLKRTNFAITVYHDDLLSLFDGLHQDEYFMTLEECAALTSLENRLQNSYIERFREFKYFTGLINIEENAFKNCTTMKDIFLPNNIKRIESNAFLNCKNLLEITLPSTLEYIGENAFAGCDMLSVIKFEGLTAPEIHPNAFGTDDNIVGKSSNCHSILLPQINNGYNTILSILSNYNQLQYLDELDLTGTVTDIGIKWIDGDEAFYKLIPTSLNGVLLTNVGNQGIHNNPNSNGMVIQLNNVSTFKINNEYFIDILQKEQTVVIDDINNLQNGRWCQSIPNSLAKNKTILIGNTQLFKEYRQLDSNGMPKWWGYPYQNGIIKGIYDVVNNKNYKLTIEEHPINKTTFIETQGNIAQYIDTGRLIKDTDTVYLRMLYCLVLNTQLSDAPVYFGYRISGTATNSVEQMTIFNEGGINGTGLASRRGTTNYFKYSSNLYDKLNPQTYIFAPNDIIFNKQIINDTLHTNLCFIDNNSVINPHIFGLNDCGSNNYSLGKLRVFEYRIVDKDNNIALQLLPHIDDNGKACLKDSVTNQLYYDANGGDLIYGEEINKVRIIDANNVLYTAELYNALKDIQTVTPLGVYVKTNEAEFIIGLEDILDNLVWGCSDVHIETCPVLGNLYEAISDINGYVNTQNIIQFSNGYTDTNGVNGSPAADSCVNYTFNNGQHGYLASLGEWIIVNKLKNEIHDCLSACNSSIGNYYYVSSTRINPRGYWACQHNTQGLTYYHTNTAQKVRPFTKVIGNTVDYIPGTVTIPYIESDGEHYLSIDTKYILSNTDEIFIDFHILNDGQNNTTNWFLPFGWRSSGNYNGTALFGVEHQSPGNTLYIFYGKSSSGGYNPSTAYERNKIHVIPTQNKMTVNGVNLNSNQFDINAPYVDGTSVVAPYIFDGNVTSKDKWAIRTMRLYSYWVKDKDGNYKIHLLPHIDENGKVCLKDLVSGECFYDTQGHDFKYGELII